MSGVIVVILVSAAFMAFFSALESAWLFSDKIRLELDKQGSPFIPGLLRRMTRNSDYFNATMLVGYTLALVAFGISVERATTPFLETRMETTWFIPIVQILLITLILLVFAEFLPRNLARLSPNQVLSFFTLPLALLYLLLWPLSAPVIAIARVIMRLIKSKQGVPGDGVRVFSKIDLDHFVRVNDPIPATQEKEVEKEVILFRNALDFSKVKLREIMVPRNEIAVLDMNSGIETLRKKFVETGFSRILFYEGNKDNIVGYVHSSAIFQKAREIKPFLKNVLIVPETMAANHLLSRFIREHRSIALVVDEFGGTAGLVTSEDILEEIFGEIEDEHDTNDFTGKKINDKQYILSGRFEIDALNEKYYLGIPESEEYETLAGFILFHHESIPKANSVVHIGRLSFKILKATLTKIELVHLTVMDN